MEIRKRIVFHGRVQGVYFRATTAELAGGRRVTGFVRNLSDGTVELEVQGSNVEIERLLEAIRERYRGQIEREETAELTLAAGQSFEIRR